MTKQKQLPVYLKSDFYKELKKELDKTVEIMKKKFKMIPKLTIEFIIRKD